ncbi:MAG: cytochrome c oxidase assembly factor Coa1 family protein [Roseiarcus sp.]|jgi:hypothetical protein
MSDASQRNPPAEIPAEIDRWNWGAFLLTWIWGIGNGVLISLLVFVPFFGILIMPFVLGAKGSAWAWRNRRWDSVEHFKRVQRLWAIWGVVVWIGAIALFFAVFGGIFYGLGHSEAYRLGVARLQASAEVAQVLGTPIATGMPMGEISLTDDSGSASLSFSATGPKGSGLVMLQAIRKGGVWSIQRLMLKIDGRDEIIDILNPTSALLDRASTRAAASLGIAA